MVGGDFTHEGDACTFETLLSRAGSSDAALRALAEIVHDIDLKDGKFARPETRGVEQVLAGLPLSHPSDEERLQGVRPREPLPGVQTRSLEGGSTMTTPTAFGVAPRSLSAGRR
jgi:hypothetical protein